MSAAKPYPNEMAPRTGTGTVEWGAAPHASSAGGALAFDQTLAPPSSAAFDATLAAPSPFADSLALTLGAPSGGLSAASLTETLTRSTVLPRLTNTESGPQLVRSDRSRYEHQSLLGQGGVGEVVRVKDHDIDRTVAVKRLRADMRAPGSIARFVDEIRTIGQLEHPNIVPIHDVGIDEEGQFFFVMKYVEGETLESIIEKLAAGDLAYHRRFTQERRVEIFLGILEAIHYAHARGIIHRDIKPANVMIGPFGEVMVMDWGLAKRLRIAEAAALPTDAVPQPLDEGKELYRTRVGTLLGTPAYMSPEQARAVELDERSDIYSLSVMFHELLGLSHYLAEQTTLGTMIVAIQQQPAKNVSFVSNPHQHSPAADLGHFVAKGLQKDVADRYQSVAEMIDRLHKRAEGDIPVQCPVTGMMSVTRQLTRFIERHPILSLGLVSFFVITALVTAAYTGLHLLRA